MREAHKLAAFVGALAFAAAVTVQAAEDKEFVKEAAQGNQFEVQAGELAQKQGNSKMVKDLGKTISADHKKANKQLEKVASQKKFEAPKEPANKSDLNDLRGLKGNDFDNKYVELMVQDHKKDIDSYQKQAQESNDPAVKKYAQDNIAACRSTYR